VTLPPLRDRPGDILPLAERLLRFFARQTAKNVSTFAEPARAALLRYGWPGNVRELRNAIERGVILAAGHAVELADLPAQVGDPHPAGRRATPPPGGDRQDGQPTAPVALDQLEAAHIQRVLAAAETMEEAAAKLGIDPSTLYRKRKKYGI